VIGVREGEEGTSEGHSPKVAVEFVYDRSIR
jgi:hypothetical protein